MTDAATSEHRRSVQSPSRWGTSAEFTARYEQYLDIVYGRHEDGTSAGGRNSLAESIGAAIADRNGQRVLDCAAGTGFPALDLAVLRPLESFTIHCTDSDRAMLEILSSRIDSHFKPQYGLALDDLAPPLDIASPRTGIDALLLEWAELDQIREPYDYVMCRGNSLVYADTWAGGKQVASDRRVKKLLRLITAKVKRGGYLHIDAPRNLADRCHEYAQNRSVDGATRIWEAVAAEGDYRSWRLSFKSDARVVKFQRFSTAMDIDDVGRMLKDLGFAQTEQVHLEHERPGFGVIIAKKVED